MTVEADIEQRLFSFFFFLVHEDENKKGREQSKNGRKIIYLSQKLESSMANDYFLCIFSFYYRGIVVVEK